MARRETIDLNMAAPDKTVFGNLSTLVESLLLKSGRLQELVNAAIGK